MYFVAKTMLYHQNFFIDHNYSLYSYVRYEGWEPWVLRQRHGFLERIMGYAGQAWVMSEKHRLWPRYRGFGGEAGVTSEKNGILSLPIGYSRELWDLGTSQWFSKVTMLSCAPGKHRARPRLLFLVNCWTTLIRRGEIPII